jgi:hypothetical protein
MRYNVYINGHNGYINFFDLEEKDIIKIANAYKKGLPQVTINHKLFEYEKIYEIAILNNDSEFPANELNDFANRAGTRSVFSRYLDTESLSRFGEIVTSQFIDDKEFGYERELETKAALERVDTYVNKKRITELRELKSPKFDLSKLIRMCEEINSNWRDENYFTVGLLLRAIINHVPPIFGTYTTFDQAVAGYGNKSFKGAMEQLNKSLRSIADGYNHHLIGKKETLPNDQQVDYKSGLDVLLAEIIKVLHPTI